MIYIYIYIYIYMVVDFLLTSEDLFDIISELQFDTSVVVEAIPRIIAGGLVAKRVLLDCVATALESDAVQESFLLQSLRIYGALFFFF